MSYTASTSARGAPRNPFEERERAQLAQHGGRFAGTDRRQADLHVADQLRGGAAGTDGDHWAEARIADNSGDQLGAGRRHPLHQESLRGDAGRRQRGAHLEPGTLGAGRREIEAHGADVGLMLRDASLCPAGPARADADERVEWPSARAASSNDPNSGTPSSKLVGMSAVTTSAARVARGRTKIAIT
jgi:hypothetical protein